MKHSHAETNVASSNVREELLTEMTGALMSLQRLLMPRHFSADSIPITPPQYMVLHMIERCGVQSVSDIATKLGVGAPAASGMIDRLEQAGYVERTRDCADRRIIRVELSPAGCELLVGVEESIRQTFRQVFSALSDEELTELIRLHRTVIESAS